MTTSLSSQPAAGRWVNGRWLEGAELQQALDQMPAAQPSRSPAQESGSADKSLIPGRWELTFYVVLFSIALTMRLWDLGARAVHHDESLHGYFSYLFYTGHGFEHNPLMHGTFLFHMIAGSFWVFGDSEFTMRLPMALFGSGLVLLPMLFRHRLGQIGAMTAALLLAFSPAMLYYSRFARNDIFMAVFTLGLVISMWRYLDDGRNRWLYLGAAFMALGFVTKETQYIVTAIVGFYLLVLAAPDVWNWLMGRKALRDFGRPGGFLVMMIGISLPLFAAGIAVVQSQIGITLAAPENTPGVQVGEPNGGLAYGIAIAFSAVFMLAGLAMGLLWKGRVWFYCWLIFAAIFATFYTTVFTHSSGIATGSWQSLGYWIAQHDVRRGSQPWYYYFMITSVYEFLPWLFAIGASAIYAWRGNKFTRFLAFWSIVNFLAYTWAGEKMPWLLVNVTLPLIILTAKAVDDIVMSVPWRRFIRNWGLLVIPGTPLLVLLAWRLIFFSRGSFDLVDFVVIWIAVAAILFLGLGLQQLANRVGWKPALGTVALALALTLLLPLTIRAGWVATYVNSDVPNDMLIYTQTSPELARVAHQIDALAKITDDKEALPIQVDFTDGFDWPWRWYLRHYTNVTYLAYDRESTDVQLGDLIYIIAAKNNSKVQPSLPVSVGDGRRIPHRWWFPENYRYGSGEYGQFIPKDFFGTIIDPNRWRGSIDYFLYRKLSNPIGSVDSYVYYSKSLPLDALP